MFEGFSALFPSFLSFCFHFFSFLFGDLGVGVHISPVQGIACGAMHNHAGFIVCLAAGLVREGNGYDRTTKKSEFKHMMGCKALHTRVQKHDYWKTQ